MFHSMNYVYEVYKERSFSKAAANLYISQPALSATVKKVEELIGSPLFDRSVNPIQLTDCGREYIKSVEKIMDIENDFEHYVGNLKDLKTGNIAIGGSNLFASYILPPVIAAFATKYPQVKVHLIEANTPELLAKLANNTLDFVIDNSIFPESIYHANVLHKERLLLAVPKSYESNTGLEKYQLTRDDIINKKHVEENTPIVPLHMFHKDSFIFLRSGNDTRSRAERICNIHNFTPNVVLKLDQQATAYNVCCYGIGATFVSDNLVRNITNEDTCYYYKVANMDAGRNVCLYHKETKYVTRAMEEFLRIAIDSFNDGY